MFIIFHSLGMRNMHEDHRRGHPVVDCKELEHIIKALKTVRYSRLEEFTRSPYDYELITSGINFKIELNCNDDENEEIRKIIEDIYD